MRTINSRERPLEGGVCGVSWWSVTLSSLTRATGPDVPRFDDARPARPQAGRRRSGPRIHYARMSIRQPVSAQDWPRLVADSMKQHGLWHTYTKLQEARRIYAEDLTLRGYVEIIRNTIVRDFLAHPRGLQLVPKLSADFLTNFERFNLNAQEGYLVSLIDGRLDVQKLLILSPFDQFNTIFILAKLQNERAITVPQ